MLKKLFFRIRTEGFIGTVMPLSSNRLAKGLFRLSSFLFKIHIPEIPFVIYYLNAVINGCEIHYKAVIGKGFSIAHSRGIVIGRSVVIGKNCKIYSGVVIGKINKNSGMPKIGDNVVLGANSTIVGDIVIGDNVKVASNTLVYKDVKSNTLVKSSQENYLKPLAND
jgi:serine O-acetyltransferase